MGRTRRQDKPLETIWEISDELREPIEPVLPEDAPPRPRANGGLPRIDWRKAIDGIFCRLRSDCQWNRLPKHFGDDISVHRRFQRWCKNGVFEKIWAALVESCDEFGAVDWKRQAADGMLGKARFGGKGRAKSPPTAASRGPGRACWSRATAARWE